MVFGRKKRIEKVASSKKERKKSAHRTEDQFEEISLGSTKRKNTGANGVEMHMEREKMNSFIAGVLNDVISFYQIDDGSAGFLQTVFIIFFMTIAPICGFLGDRYNRKMIILIGLSIWVGAVLASSFIPSNHFWAFVLLRGVVGIGEASYAVIAPTLIADLFAGKKRSRILMVFYFAIPLGSGLGYVVGASTTSFAKAGRPDCGDCWQWGIRVTPVLGLFCMASLLLGVQEPVRGQAEREEAAESSAAEATMNGNTGTNEEEQQKSDRNTATNDASLATILKGQMHSYIGDLQYLAKNRTFVWSTIGYTAVVFVTGTLTWWSPAAVEQAIAWDKALKNTSDLDPAVKSGVSTVFGVITCIGGIIGVAMGTILSQAWKQGKSCFRHRPSIKADPLISAAGSFAAAPLLFLGLRLIHAQLALAGVVIFATIVCLCLNWAVNVDMLMSIIEPRRRSTASAVQILISHAFGDASGPWIVGAISDWVHGTESSPEWKFRSLMLAFYLPNALLLFSGFAFLGAAFTLPGTIKQQQQQQREQRRTDVIHPIAPAVVLSPPSANAHTADRHQGSAQVARGNLNQAYK